MAWFERTHPLFPYRHGPRACAAGSRGGVCFRVWAPKVETVGLVAGEESAPAVPMQSQPGGWWELTVEAARPGERYLFELNGGQRRPDPASRWQPDGVHRASAVLNADHSWQDAAWPGLPLSELVLYELHTGTFTPEGTFEAVIPHLDRLADLGITAIELMPVAQFPGSRNWGYDGVHPFAVQNSYGGPTGLKQLVDACHQRGLAVILDVVFNHLGPEGNYLAEFAPYFTGRYRTAWGEALNFDGPHSDEVRRFFIENALYWLTEFHIDGLRLDAVHAIFDQSARPFLKELARAVHELSQIQNRPLHLIAESNLNDPKLVRHPEAGGYGLHAQWVDDFHHALHVTLTGERNGYYSDYAGVPDVVTSLRRGYVFAGQFSKYRARRHGPDEGHLESSQVVVCSQNHDQTGNRLNGERLAHLVSFEQLKLAAAAVLLAPQIPLLFMGEEYADPAPFLYFVSHSDPALVAAVRKGRQRDFQHFQWKGTPPDPQSEDTFHRCILRQELSTRDQHAVLHDFYRALLTLRREMPSSALSSHDTVEVLDFPGLPAWGLLRKSETTRFLTLFNAGPTSLNLPLPPSDSSSPWHLRLSSPAPRWNGPGSPLPEVISPGQPLILPEFSVVVLDSN